MNPAIAKVFEILGGPSNVARLVGKNNPWTVSKWRRKLPPERVIELAGLVEFEVTPHQMAPDLYPYPTDGVPLELRGLRC